MHDSVLQKQAGGHFPFLKPIWYLIMDYLHLKENTSLYSLGYQSSFNFDW